MSIRIDARKYRDLAWVISPEKDGLMHPCGCIGPQEGAPLCPCRMRNVQIVNGRYVETIDLGPAPKGEAA